MPSENRPCYIDAVPAELLDKIFVYAIPSRNWKEGDQHDNSRLDLCLSLSQTCSTWRDIALSRSRLWDTLLVRFHNVKQTPDQHLVDLMMARSANVRLSIDLRMIDTDESVFADPNSAQYRSLQVLLGSIARWRDFSLYLRGSSLPLPLSAQLSATGASSLECLSLDVRLQSKESDSHLPILWERSPRLRKIWISVLNRMTTYYTIVQDSIPYSQVTSLCLHSSASRGVISVDLVVDILHRAPNLVSFMIANIVVDQDSALPTMSKSPILHHLEYLHLGGCLPVPLHPATISELPLTEALDYFAAPSLKTLAFSNMDMWGQPEFESFIVRSGCLLEEIHFFNPPNLGTSTLIPILRGIPSIKGIHLGRLLNLLDEPTFVNDMMSWNTSRNEFELCPDLSWLSFYDPTCFDIEPNCDINKLGMEGLVRILKTRLGPPDGGERRFERIYVPSDKLSTEDYHDIRVLCTSPHPLDVQPDDDMYNIHNQWERYCSN